MPVRSECPIMYKVGVTGGIGSGKSVVCKMLQEHGAAVYDSDRHAKALMAESAHIREQLIASFGPDCFICGQLDRKYLASKVFGNEVALQKLNAIVHPAVREDFRRWAEEQRSPYVVLESAILFESGFDSEVDTTLAVMAPVEERVRRCMERDNASRDTIMSRISHQMSDDELFRRAKRTIVNLRLDYLEDDVQQLHKIFCHEANL